MKFHVFFFVVGLLVSSSSHAEAPFKMACPEPGKAHAQQIETDEFRPKGPSVLGQKGDFILANEKAAFVVTSAASENTYFYYGGILVDAFGISQCEQVGDELFDELQLLSVALNPADPYTSTVRAFHALSLEVLNDGNNGEAAVVRAIGMDDFYYTAELEIIKRGFMSGSPRKRSTPMSVNMIVDYILEPGSSVLKIVQYTRLTDPNPDYAYFGAVLLTPGRGPDLSTFAGQNLSFGSLQMDILLPWISSGNHTGGYAFALQGENMSNMDTFGIAGIMDLRKVMGAGDDSIMRMQTYFVSVSGKSESAAIKALAHINPAKTPFKRTLLSGSLAHNLLLAEPEKTPIILEINNQKPGKEPKWAKYATLYPDASGNFRDYLPTPDPKYVHGFRLRAAGQIFDYDPTLGHVQIAKTLSEVEVQVSDGRGNIPAKLDVYQNALLVKSYYLGLSAKTISLPPGVYEFEFSRGFEYAIEVLQVDLRDVPATSILVTLPHLVNTEGYESFDAHLHQNQSMDSRVSNYDRVLSAAAAGLDIAVSADHEFVTDMSSALLATGLEAHVATFPGQEVTASLPGHLLMFPLPLNEQHNQRGSPIKWHGLPLEGIFAAGFARGAPIVAFAHPRNSDCGFFCLIDWDPSQGRPGLAHPGDLFLRPDQKLWSWNFNAIELLNGPKSPFKVPGQESTTGVFDDWANFLNMGRIVVPMGNSDSHDMKSPAMPRTYVKVEHNPSASEFSSSFLGGNVLISTGAFAAVLANQEATFGELLEVSDDHLELSIRIEALPEVEVAYFKVFHNCDEVARIDTSSPEGTVVKYDGTIDIALPGSKDANIIVAGFGTKPLPRAFPALDTENVPRFISNAIFLDRNQNGQYDAPGPKTCAYNLN